MGSTPEKKHRHGRERGGRAELSTNTFTVYLHLNVCPALYISLFKTNDLGGQRGMIDGLESIILPNHQDIFILQVGRCFVWHFDLFYVFFYVLLFAVFVFKVPEFIRLPISIRRD